MDIGVRQLHLFKEVARCNSINKASQLLHISQPTLSRRMRDLEIQMKTSLFIRSAKGIALTQAGKDLLKLAYALSDTFSDLKSEKPEVAGKNQRGAYQIGVAPSLSHLVLPLLFRLANVDDQPVMIQEGTTLNLCKLISEGAIVGAIVSGHISPARFNSIAIWQEPLFYIAPRQADNYIPFVMSSQDPLIRHLIETRMKSLHATTHRIHEIYSAPNVMALINENLAASVLPYSAIYRYINNDNLLFQPIENFYLKRYFIWSKTDTTPQQTADAIALVRQLGKQLCSQMDHPGFHLISESEATPCDELA